MRSTSQKNIRHSNIKGVFKKIRCNYPRRVTKRKLYILVWYLCSITSFSPGRCSQECLPRVLIASFKNTKKEILYNPNEIQPIDSYVKGVLEHVKRNHSLRIDTENPTRGQRLEAAVMLDNKDPWAAAEIMIGKRVGATDDDGKLLQEMMILRAFKREIRHFYSGFAHRYWPKKEENADTSP